MKRFLTLTVGACATVCTATGPVAIGSRLQLLWDDALVDAARTTATRVLHAPEYAGEVMTFDKPWEGDACGYFNILTDSDEKGRLYRMYYIAWNLNDGDKKELPFAYGRRICYAESRDGLAWHKPELGICTFAKPYGRIRVKETTANNIIVDCSKLEFLDNFMVLKDPRPACPAAERYKALSLDYRRNEKRQRVSDGLSCHVSPDGVHFTYGWKLTGVGPGTGVNGDTLNCAFFEPRFGRFVLYGRGGHGAKNGSRREGVDGVRDIRRTVSADFHTWTHPEPIRFARDAEDYALYTNVIEPYYRDPSVYVGLPTRYVENPEWTDNFTKLCGAAARRARMKGHARYGLAVTDCVFMFSRDGEVFDRCDEAFLRPGPEGDGNWAYGDCYPARGIVLTPGRRGRDEEMSFYVPNGHWTGRAARLERHCLRQDGFLSRHGTYRPQTLVTKPFVYAGGRLFINFSTSARGTVTVTLRAQTGETLTSDPLFGDRIDREVGFGAKSPKVFAGRPVTLTFVLSDADVYSFRFAD